MAQVEIIMYVGFGFATAALIALLLGRVVWNLAIGIGRRRAQRTAATPAVAQLQAERNQLRAEYAMLARRVEVRLDDLKAQVAEHMAEVSRSRNRIDRLGTEIEKRDASLAEREREIARLNERIAVLEAELANRTSSLLKLEDDHGKGGEAIAALRQQVAERDQYIEHLRAEVERLGVARSEAVSRERSVQQRLKGRIEDLSALSRQIEAQRRELMARKSHSAALREGMAGQDHPEKGAEAVAEAPPPEPLDSDAEPLERRIEDTERQASELESELDRLDAIWTAKLADVASAVAVEPPAAEAAGSEASASPEAASVNGSGGKPVAGEAERAVAPVEDDKKTGLANVISLAQRIRALQRNGS
jgi:chromosome segregation ATPase